MVVTWNHVIPKEHVFEGRGPLKAWTLIGWDEEFFCQTFIDIIQAMHDEEMTNFLY
jgi:hypothetical protein